MDDLFLMRGIERLAIVLGGVAVAYLGYKLYLHGAGTARTNVNFSSRLMKFAASGTGPGMLFIVFGCAILVCSLIFGGVSSQVRTTTPSNTTDATRGAISPVEVITEELRLEKSKAPADMPAGDGYKPSRHGESALSDPAGARSSKEAVKPYASQGHRSLSRAQQNSRNPLPDRETEPFASVEQHNEIMRSPAPAK